MMAKGNAFVGGSNGNWPRDGSESDRHVWKYKCHGRVGGKVEVCERCSGMRMDGALAPVYCHATFRWLKDHPEDDSKTG